MGKWDGCKEEKCKLWDDDDFCMLSDHYHEYCTRTGKYYQPQTKHAIDDPVRCKLCGTTGAYSEFRVTCDNDSESTIHILCKPVCMNCMKIFMEGLFKKGTR